MPSSSAAVRSFVLALFGLGAGSAFAQGPNVTAFNPYSGVGLPGGPTATYGPQAAYPIVDTVGPASGPAFNPWQPQGPLPSPGVSAGAFNPGQQTGAGSVGAARPAPVNVYNPGANLPPPPRHLGSRILAIPERGNVRIPRDLLYSSPPAPPPAAASAEPRPAPVAPAPVGVAAPTPTMPTPASPSPAARPAPPVVAVTPPVAAPTPPPAAAPAAAGRPLAVTSAPNVGPAAKGATVASIPFAGQSADLSDVAKAELDRVARNITDKALRQVELRAFATGPDPESRKIALARALVVRSYLIDRGVRSRIEVGGFSGGDGERVDILVPNT